MADNNIKQIMLFVRNAAIVLISAYFLNRLIWFYVTQSARAGNREPAILFVRYLHMFPSTYTPVAEDTPTLLWGYFLTIIFVTLLALIVQKLRGK